LLLLRCWLLLRGCLWLLLRVCLRLLCWLLCWLLRWLLRGMCLWLCCVWWGRLWQGGCLGLLWVLLCQRLSGYAGGLRWCWLRVRWGRVRQLWGVMATVAGRGMLLVCCMGCMGCLGQVCCMVEGVLCALCFADIWVRVVHGVGVEAHVPVFAHSQTRNVQLLHQLLTLHAATKPHVVHKTTVAQHARPAARQVMCHVSCRSSLACKPCHLLCLLNPCHGNVLIYSLCLPLPSTAVAS